VDCASLKLLVHAGQPEVEFGMDDDCAQRFWAERIIASQRAQILITHRGKSSWFHHVKLVESRFKSFIGGQLTTDHHYLFTSQRGRHAAYNQASGGIDRVSEWHSLNATTISCGMTSSRKGKTRRARRILIRFPDSGVKYRRSHIRQFVWVSVIVAQVTILVALRVMSH
jgi:hypothetical protein